MAVNQTLHTTENLKALVAPLIILHRHLVAKYDNCKMKLHSDFKNTRNISVVKKTLLHSMMFNKFT